MLIIIINWTSTQVCYRCNHRNSISWEKTFICKLKEKVPFKSRIYQIDGSGWTGYFSERHIFNGDGLVNTYKYYNLMKTQNLQNYLTDNNIEYIITNGKISGDKIVDMNGLVVYKRQADLVIDVPSNLTNKHSFYRLFKLKHNQSKN